jgi:hypothetical protein
LNSLFSTELEVAVFVVDVPTVEGLTNVGLKACVFTWPNLIVNGDAAALLQIPPTRVLLMRVVMPKRFVSEVEIVCLALQLVSVVLFEKYMLVPDPYKTANLLPVPSTLPVPYSEIETGAAVPLTVASIANAFGIVALPNASDQVATLEALEPAK